MDVSRLARHRQVSYALLWFLCASLAGCTSAPAVGPTAAPRPSPTSPAAMVVPVTPTTLPAITTMPSLPVGTVAPLPVASSGPPVLPAKGPVPVYTYRVVQTFPHDPTAFTEGLVYSGGFLYEGTGLTGRSDIRKVELATGKVVQVRKLPDQYFGEGIAIVGNRLIELTWQSHLGFVYDKAIFEPLSQFTYPTEGWGLAYDGQRLIMSDGTATLHFRDPGTLAETGQLEVTANGQPITQLNELEYVDGDIYANVWQTDRIARIAPQAGQVTGWIDLTGLLSPADRRQPVDVLNGIAYDPAGRRLFVTGKLWPKLFQIELAPRN